MTYNHEAERPSKRAKLIAEGSDSGESESDSVAPDTSNMTFANGVNGFTINEEYAKRFEHNKKREELHRLEEKYKVSGNSRRKWQGGQEVEDEDSEEDDDSTSEEEDDDAELATADVDQEILATLKAIKNKDPRVYDQDVQFYREYDPDAAGGAASKQSTEKPMFLSDYHRQNLMDGYNGEEVNDKLVTTYQEEQDALKRDLVSSMHASKQDESSDGEENDDFLVAKSRPRHAELPSSKKVKITDNDIKTAEQDPDTYLSNFMAARAWLPNQGTQWQPFESDDSDDEARADAFEEAYNMRFEDPKTANEKLQSFARDVGKYGVRREDKSRRQLARQQEQEAKEAKRRERDEERARLRKLKLEEAEEKVRRIKSVAGIRNQELDMEAWRDIIEGDFDDAKWEQEMMRRFGDAYYAQVDDGHIASNDEDEDHDSSKLKAKKPKWTDDIDIKDLLPDFEDEDPRIQLTSDEEDDRPLPSHDTNDENAEPVQKRHKTKKDRMKEKGDAKRVARKERARLEDMIDAAIPLSHPELAPSATTSKAPAIQFRYRATSPTSFGMSSRDILFADDAQLNQFAGLKKLAAFRDNDKKARDKKKFSKKARLKQWRKETFGNPDEPQGGFERVLGDDTATTTYDTSAKNASIKEGGKRKRKGKKKQDKATIV